MNQSDLIIKVHVVLVTDLFHHGPPHPLRLENAVLRHSSPERDPDRGRESAAAGARVEPRGGRQTASPAIGSNVARSRNTAKLISKPGAFEPGHGACPVTTFYPLACVVRLILL